MRNYVLLFLAYASGSCSSNNGLSNANIKDSTGAPVETRRPNTDYKPAYAGQTRVAGVRTTTPYESRVLTTELRKPWGIVALPDGRLLVTEKGGTMRLVAPGGTVGAPISGLPPVNAGGQGGLLGLTIDPGFASNRTVYWVFSDRLPEGNCTAVGKGQLSADDARIENAQIIYRALPAYNGNLHYGGRILFDRNGHLLVTTGERSDLVTRPQAQALESALGKIVRITADGKPAPGNPFANNANAKPEVWTYGHRNPQGISFHPQTGDLWENEFGPRGGDELNIIQSGKNYGWPVISYGLEYSGGKIGQGITQQTGMEQPVYYWDPVLSPSGMTFYSGNGLSEWKNNLFIAGLNSNHLARLIISNNRVTGEERLLANEGQRFRDVAEGKDGVLYAVTDEGRLYRIAKK